MTVNFSKFCVRFLCVASVVVGLDISGSVEVDTITHARGQTAQTKYLDILRDSRLMNSTQMTSSEWNMCSETASSPSAVQSFETDDVYLGEDILLFYYTHFLVAEDHGHAIHRALEQSSDVSLQDGGTELNGVEFVLGDVHDCDDNVVEDQDDDNTTYLPNFSTSVDSSFLRHSPFLYSSVPACQHSFLTRNLFFLLIPITFYLIVRQKFFQSKNQVTSIKNHGSKEDLVHSETTTDEKIKKKKKVIEKENHHDHPHTNHNGELLLDLDAPLSKEKPNCIVYRGTLCHEPVAVKVSHKAGSYSQASREPAEVKYLKHLHHPRVVKVVMSLSNTPFKIRLSSSQAQREQTGMSYETLIVTEYCDRGSLRDGLKNHLFSVPAKYRHITTCALEIAQAMAHVHSKRIIHGALDAKHIFLQSSLTDPRGYTCKVGGFGSCLRLPHGSASVQFNRNQCMTIAAPEAIKAGFLLYASDVFAFGCLLYKMCMNHSLFNGHRRGDIHQLIVAGRRPGIPKYVPSQLAELIAQCWSQCPHERPSFLCITQILEACVHSQERCIPASRPRPFCHCPPVSVETIDRCKQGSLVPGKRYARINFQPFTEPERTAFSASDLGRDTNKDKRLVTARRTKSCSLTLERKDSMSEMNNAAYVRQVVDLFKTDGRSESKAELKQFLKTLECKWT